MTTNQQLEAIREEIADKTLDFGCYVYEFLNKKDSKLADEKAKKGYGVITHARYGGKRVAQGGNKKHCLIDRVTGVTSPGSSTVYLSHHGFGIFFGENTYEILGHPPHIGTITQWYQAEHEPRSISVFAGTLSLKRPSNKLDQPLPLPGEDTTGWEGVILFIHSLLPGN